MCVCGWGGGGGGGGGGIVKLKKIISLHEGGGGVDISGMIQFAHGIST